MTLDHIKFIGPSRMTEAEEYFFSELFIIIGHADPFYKITINKKPLEVMAHVEPSNPAFKDQIVTNLLHFNRTKRNFRIHFSSSLAISKIISFTIV